MKSISYIRIMIVLVFLIIGFHLCLIAKLIPYRFAWGGRLKTDNEMYLFELISIVINLFLILVLLVKGNYLRFRLKEKFINSVLWIFFFIFILTTIGNIVAKTKLEKAFSVLTLVLAILIWTILKKKQK
jgi:hypothetical protein